MWDRAEIDSLFRAHAEALFRFLRSFRLPEDETYELVQSAFEKLLSADPREVRAPKAWLFTVGRNMALNRLKTDRRTDALPPDADPESDLPDALSRLLEDERNAGLWAAFGALSPKDQELLRLQYQHDLSHKEIAQVVGMPAIAVRVAAFRARERLRKALDDREAREERRAADAVAPRA
ncbi:MAG: sigma-70 family RNA polymerase sigma factor [Myxococcales bacterium]|nr:MAG: sigma-70 family RNA polymerase sigma factor [Myxococcales bacterium]